MPEIFSVFRDSTRKKLYHHLNTRASKKLADITVFYYQCSLLVKTQQC